jgi:hypothetical protein
MESINDVYGCNHVHVKEGGEHGEVGGNIASKGRNDCLWTVHESARHLPSFAPLHYIYDYKRDKECGVTKGRIARSILENIFVDVMGEKKKG